MKHAVKLSLILVLTLLATLSIALISIQTSAADDVRQAVEVGNAKWMEAFNRGDAAAVAARYTDNAILMPPNSEMIQGRQGIQEFWHDAIENGLKDASLTTVSVQTSGETAYEIGKFSLTAYAEGKEPQLVSGKYVVVWQRDSDDSWKLHVDIWNSSMPAQ